MTVKLIFSKTDVPLGAVFVCQLAKFPYEWGEKTQLPLNSSCTLCTSYSISRHIARLHPELDLYPSNILHRTEVDHWLTLSCGPLGTNKDITAALTQLDSALTPAPFLTAGKLTIADLEVFASLYKSSEWRELVTKKTGPQYVLRWYNHILKKVGSVLSSLPPKILSSLPSNQEETSSAGKREDVGKFVDLPDAKMGEVVVRFPPEASGYLHIGHAKAALLNQYYQRAFQGRLIMRFDDTNPEKEKADFEKVIMEDLKLLEIEPDQYSFTSDYFDQMLGMCETLIRSGSAYVDDTDAETMKKERDERKESKNRSNSVEVNLKMWNDMKTGSECGQKCCVRAKIDMNSANGCMRDPTIYRCKNEPHPRTGSKFNVYPTYDFACPIVDSVEGVTHALRTTEYHDRDEQFFWFIKNLDLRPVHIYEYSRLNMNNTVLSKRKLAWFVNEGLVDGWDDPRFPTVRGILRRGMTIEGLKDFIIAQGSSRSVVNMEWDKIWAFNKKVIDREAPRYTALQGNLVPVFVQGAIEEFKDAQKHPKDPSKGMKTICVGPKVFIESVDAAELKEGENATFINWGNLKIIKIHKKGEEIEKVEAEPNLSNTDFKKTLKLTWLSESSNAPWTPLVCSFFGHLISKSVLGKDEDFKSFINNSTRSDVQMVGDDEMKQLKPGSIVQLQRKGFFRVDESYKPFSASSCKESPVVLYYIPDGHTKEQVSVPTKGGPLSDKEIKNAAKGKQAEKSPQVESKPISDANKSLELHSKIKEQGDKIRKLKTDKADKSAVVAEVEILKALKADFKVLTGMEWTPEIDINKFVSFESKLAVEQENVSEQPDSIHSLHLKIKDQGDKIRKMKSDKADKSVVVAEVEVLKSLKSVFRSEAGYEWTPNIDISKLSATKIEPEVKTDSKQDEKILAVHQKIKDQGDKIRKLKSEKADKSVVMAEVEILKSYKLDFKSQTGSEWTPDIDVNKFVASENKAVVEGKTSSDSPNSILIHQKIKEQGDKIRELKSLKVEKSIVMIEVEILKAFKSDFKLHTGIDWSPDIDMSKFTASLDSQKPKTAEENGDLKLHLKIKEQGDKIRKLKSEKAEKSIVMAEVDTLKAYKAEFKAQTGLEWTPGIDISQSCTEPKPKSESKAVAKRDEAVTKTSQRVMDQEGEKDKTGKKQTRLGLEARKGANFSEWYSQVITKSEMIEYYNVSGCYILRPWSYEIWELIKEFFDKEIKALGVKNAYFPIFVSKDALEKEKTHIADFSPEVAWVTRSGSSEMAEPVAIRPTSETVMYPAFAKWIQSHRDLPIKINQWNNVVRWEFKQPTPFLRTREFLWQEGHTAYATKEEACDEVYTILELYARIYEELLAIPVVRGHKTKKEQFAGGDFTTTTEAYISASGRGIQGATSHHLGQNFSKMFDIVFEDPETREKKYAYQNSWGLTTRTIGVMVMVHGDDKGLVLPPRVAPVQVVIIPVGITAKTSDEEKKVLYKFCSEIKEELSVKDIKTQCDFDDHVTPGWKFNHWELKGVPLRIEIGPKELAESKVFAVRRDNGEKQSLDKMFIERRIFNLLETIHTDMFNKAKDDLSSHKTQVNSWPEFVASLEKGNLQLAPFCGVEECEDEIKKESARNEPSDAGAPSMGAKGLCIPFEQPGKVDGLKCINPKCQRTPKFYTLFGRSY